MATDRAWRQERIRHAGSISADRVDAGIEILADVVENAGTSAPVEQWHPPFCGDIDMRIARDGTWYYCGSSINRLSLVRLFSRILRKDNDRYVLVTPVEMVGIKVDDAPFIAVEMTARGDGRAPVLWFRTNVDDWVSADAQHPLRFEIGDAGGLKPYIRVRGDLWALVKRSLLLDLIALAETKEFEGSPWLGIMSAGQFFPIVRADEIEGIEQGEPVGAGRS